MSYQAAKHAFSKKLITIDLKNIVALKAANVSNRLQKAIETTRLLAEDPSLIEWFVGQEKDKSLAKLSKKRLTQIRKNHDYASVFAVNELTGNYWKQEGNLVKVISQEDTNDAWFFAFMKSGNYLELRIDYNQELGSTYVLTHALIGTSREPLGIAGVSIDVSSLAQDFTKADSYGGMSWLVDTKGIIQISNKPEEIGKSFAEIIGEAVNLKISDSQTEITASEFLHKSKGRQFYAHAPIANTKWFIVYTVDDSSMTKPLVRIRWAILLSGIASVMLVTIAFYFLSHRFTQPIGNLTNVARSIAQGNLDEKYQSTSQNEIGLLANALNTMTNNLKTSKEKLLESKQDLETQVAMCTNELEVKSLELSLALEDIQKLKLQQDGDYYLTSRLSETFACKSITSDAFTIDSFIKQQKEFTFDREKRRVGGDVNMADTIYLKGKKYLVFLNGDAMGKSSQGAAGVLVLGTAFTVLIAKTQKEKPNIASHSWLVHTFRELHTLLIAFAGKMLVSATIGILEEETGEILYINAEHPYSVLFRNGKAKFLDSKNHHYKLGTEPMDLKKVFVRKVHLELGDTFLLGSYGKDENQVSNGAKVESTNDNPSLFLHCVENTEADLQGIYESIREKGEITDDFSLLKITRTS